MRDDVRPDVDRELARLKDFQRATVDHVHRRLWTDAEPTRRFLVADEVGLGKTMVARGVIARAVDHLWDREERIDVVYICSNSQIARQNLRRLNIGGFSVDHADRLTLLPTVIEDLKARRINFISFTPGTSFHISESGGRMSERVLIHRLLAQAWGSRAVSSTAWRKFFVGSAGLDNYDAELAAARRNRIDEALTKRFAEDIADSTCYDDTPLTDALLEAVDRFRYRRSAPPRDLSRHRYRLIGQMRNLVARAAVESLEPDLVILDEFQRFKDLLDPHPPGADLAHAVFDQPTARVLLLSATPYKMYTLPDEPEGDDHYQDFTRTIEFLGGAELAQDVQKHLSVVRSVLLSGGDPVVGRAAREKAEGLLRGVMSRTERTAVTERVDAMVGEATMPDVTLTGRDVRAYASAAKIAQAVDRQDVFEYWRSSPYLFNIMEGYQVKKRLADHLVKPHADLVNALAEAEGLLHWDDLRRYRALDPGNAKMRVLVTDVLDRGMWRVLWLPPSLPYYELGGAYAEEQIRDFTKRLVFSAWNVVPKAISLVLSYEAERRTMELGGGTRAYDDERQTGLLRFQVDSSGRLTGLPVLALLYPSTTLARLGDPLAHARHTASGLPAPASDVLASVRQEVANALYGLPAGATDGPEDQRWYWAAPFLLDIDVPGQPDFMTEMAAWGEEEPQGRLQDHIRAAAEIDAHTLGRRPSDLVDVVTLLAVAGPGVCSLRALSRVCGGPSALDDAATRDCAAYISWGLRALFNRPESMSLLRPGGDDGTPYWRSVLQHCWDGGLQAVLDEYVHVLVESEGLQDEDGAERADRLQETMVSALELRAARVQVDELSVGQSGPQLTSHNARTHFAARFGRSQSDEQAVQQREGQVRTAYNSPFWPFVLASTSVGQEGLDFHTYSHAVVHWNLPSNPVDLEQREGRVHRYKGHAIRRNIARRYAHAAYHASVDDPWFAMFLAAVDERGGADDRHPFWLFPADGGCTIERYVPAMPLSKESARYRRLLRTVGAYRLVMGQPRQEDLLRYLNDAGETHWARLHLEPTT